VGAARGARLRPAEAGAMGSSSGASSGCRAFACESRIFRPQVGQRCFANSLPAHGTGWSAGSVSRYTTLLPVRALLKFLQSLHGVAPTPNPGVFKARRLGVPLNSRQRVIKKKKEQGRERRVARQAARHSSRSTSRYRGTSLIINSLSVGSNNSPMRRDLWWS